MGFSFSLRLLTLALLGSLLLTSLVTATKHKINDEEEAEEFMKELDARYSVECNREMVARWEYIVDVSNPDKEEAADEAAVRYLNFKGEAAVNSSQFEYGDFDSIELYRRFRFLSKQGPGALDSDDLNEYKAHQSKMETIYSTATICDYYDETKCDLTLEPDIEAIMASSENWDELRYVWDQWREVSGKLMRDDYIRFVELSNKAATLDGFSDTSMYWLNGYTVDDREAESFVEAAPLDQNEFREDVDSVWSVVSEELYKKVHSYVRWKMADVYPGQIDLKGPLPAHILGNMWAQDWLNIADHVMPFPEFPSFDVSESMKENGWDIQQMFDSAQDFFESIKLFPMTQDFWDKSVINQTAWGKTMLCHASAEDFCLGPDGNDYRIKMCTEVNMEDLITVHHEMGHIEYFMAYKNQPHVFRESANPGFHEAIGDLIALSVSTPTHLENILHLTPKILSPVVPQSPSSTKYTDDEKRALNFLMRMALEKVAFLPFGFLIDKFRWGVFDGSIPIENMNAGWWKLREEIQGVTPPGETRGEEFFDPGAKYHVPANVPYIRYFVSFIVQFQFHAHLCEIAGHTGPLYTCDIYNNTDAGAVLKGALERGFSEPWPIVLQDLGGSLDMDPTAIISYFEPLITLIDEELASAEQCIGWGDDCVTYLYDDIMERNGDDDTNDEPDPNSTSTSETTSRSSTSSTPGTSSSTISTSATTEPSSPTISTSTTPGTSSPTISTSTTPGTSSPTSYMSTSSSEGVSTSDISLTPEDTTTMEITTVDPESETAAKIEMKKMDTEITELVQNAVEADWAYETNMSDENRNASIAAWLKVKQAFRGNHADVIEYFDYKNFTDPDLVRQFELQENGGSALLQDADLTELHNLLYKMEKTYRKKICPASNKNDCNLDNDGLAVYELGGIMATRDTSFNDLEYYWKEWRDESAKNMLDDFRDYMTLENKAAAINGFGNVSSMWMAAYTDANYSSDMFTSDIADLWNATQPLYAKLRVYVLDKLKKYYGSDIANDEDLIPVHLLGDMLGENWENIYDIVKPFENVTLVNITDVLDQKLESVSQMAVIAEEFFQNLDLFNMTDDFNENSTFWGTGDNMFSCQPSAFDFYDTPSILHSPRKDGRFRIKMCANKTQEDLIKIHHLMGNIQYQMAYSEKDGLRFPLSRMPIVFRDGANPGFHEAIGGAFGLLASAPSYLQDVADSFNNEGSSFRISHENPPMTGNVDYTDAEKQEISFLLKTALAEIPPLPYAYILDAWRWEVFADNNTEKDYNKRWWRLRIAEQGVAPPVERYPESDFDPGSKYEVVANIPYIGQFVSHILKFQVLDKLCNGEFYDCSIYNVTEAGPALMDMMVLGRSQDWKTTLTDFLEDGMNATALMKYFQPLEDFLDGYIEINKLSVTWNKDQLDDYIKNEPEEISAIVPIIVGCVLLAMVLVVIIAYFVGRKKQKAKRKAQKDKKEIISKPDDMELGKTNEAVEVEEEEKEEKEEKEKF